MTIETAKAAALEALLAGPWAPDPTDSRAPAVHLLKREGVPVVSREVKRGGQVRTEHRLIETDLQPDAIRKARQEGLAMALRWHRREPADNWVELVKGITCPFQQDEAKTYLAGIKLRGQLAGH